MRDGERDPYQKRSGTLFIPDFAAMLEGYWELPNKGRRIVIILICLAPLSFGIVAIGFAIARALG